MSEEQKKIVEDNWVTIKKYSSHEINKNGCIRNKKTKYILKTCILNSGYLACSKFGTIHRLLAEAFIPNINNGNEVNHIDGNKLNNTLTNLEWVTSSENRQHAYDMGLLKGRGKLTPRDKSDIIKKYNKGIYQSTLAKEYGVSQATISNCVRGKH